MASAMALTACPISAKVALQDTWGMLSAPASSSLAISSAASSRAAAVFLRSLTEP